MFSLRVDAADVDWQIRLIKEFPDISDRHFRPAMDAATDGLAGEIEPNIPVASGRAAGTFKNRVTGRGLRLTGRVGWWYASDPWYVNVLEYGAGVHEQNSYIPNLGVYIARHPGFPAKNFMRNADQSLRQRNDERFAQARDRVVADMTVRSGGGL